MTLKQTISIEFSYSFQWGNAIREAVIRPWKLPFLPISLWRAHQNIQRYRKDLTSMTPYLFVIDHQKFSRSDKIEFQTFFNSLQECELLIIGDEHVDAAAHHFPSSRSSGKDKRQWNSDLQRLLAVIVESTRPEKFVFIGQYPYAGITGVLRTLQPKKDTAWLPMHAKPEALTERSAYFGHILDWPSSSSGNWNLKDDCVYISDKLSGDFSSLLKQNIARLNLTQGSKNQAKVHFLHPDDEVDEQLEEKQLIAVTLVDHATEPSKVIGKHPANHIVFFNHDEVFFRTQLEAFFENVANGFFPGPKTSMIEEKAWVQLYSSF